MIFHIKHQPNRKATAQHFLRKERRNAGSFRVSNVLKGMKKKLLALFLIFTLILPIFGCSPPPASTSSFRITFIDVGQGDAALIECDGHFMLIDGGDTYAAEAVDRVLTDRLSKANTTKLDFLVASHHHKDHIGGLIEGLDYVTEVDLTLSNVTSYDSKTFDKFNQRVLKLGSEITVPDIGATYSLGSAKIQVIDTRNKKENDSLVLLLSYGNTNFLFTGDVEEDAQKRVVDALRNSAIADKLRSGKNLIKMPHHGAYNSDSFLPDNASDNYLYTLLDAYYAEYFVISVGENNKYGHPHENTLTVIGQALEVWERDPAKHLFRTDKNGDIVVESNGSEIIITPTKQ